ncbi:hypothetical protein FOA52_004449 [Chlamydomonas sp. UWO 241]|nr:hypothetical protein FOA52_004449 [Chlamydomonas sp. UWO 241]
MMPLSTRGLLAASAVMALVFAAGGAHAGQKNFKVTIAHMNDNHNRIEAATESYGPCTASGACYGGWARIATAVKMARAKDPQALILSAGDEFLGSLYQSVYEGNETAELQNMVGIQAMALGNHEFDFGTAYLARYLKQLNFPVLGCNIDTSKDPNMAGLLQDYAIFTVRGERIAVYGVTTEETAFLATPGNTTFIDPIAAIQRCVAKAKSEVKYIRSHILLSHLGYTLDKQIATLIPEIDLVIGGHSHTFLYPENATAPRLISNVSTSSDTPAGPYPTSLMNEVQGRVAHVVQASWGTRYVGYLELKYARKLPGGVAVAVETDVWLLGNNNSDVDIEGDHAVGARIEELSTKISAFFKLPAGSLTVPLNGVRTDARARETTMGDALCNAWVDFVKTETELEQTLGITVDMCVTNGGGIRASIPAGNITYADVFTVLPFGNTLTVINITGARLKSAIELGVSGVEAGAGRFPQIAGLKFAYNANNLIGSRVVSLTTAAGVELDDCASYYVVTNNYVAAGGDFYADFAASEQVLSVGPLLDIITKDYFMKNSPFSIKLDGRIVSCSDTPEYPACSGPGVLGGVKECM